MRCWPTPILDRRTRRFGSELTIPTPPDVRDRFSRFDVVKQTRTRKSACAELIGIPFTSFQNEGGIMESQSKNSPILDSPPPTDENGDVKLSDEKNKGCFLDGVEFGEGGVGCIGGITHMCVAGSWFRTGNTC